MRSGRSLRKTFRNILDLLPLVPRKIGNVCSFELLAELAQRSSVDKRNSWIFHSECNRAAGKYGTRDDPCVGTAIVKLSSDHFLNCLVSNYASPAFGLAGALLAVLG